MLSRSIDFNAALRRTNDKSTRTVDNQRGTPPNWLISKLHLPSCLVSPRHFAELLISTQHTADGSIINAALSDQTDQNCQRNCCWSKGPSYHRGIIPIRSIREFEGQTDLSALRVGINAVSTEQDVDQRWNHWLYWSYSTRHSAEQDGQSVWRIISILRSDRSEQRGRRRPEQFLTQTVTVSWYYICCQSRTTCLYPRRTIHGARTANSKYSLSTKSLQRLDADIIRKYPLLCIYLCLQWIISSRISTQCINWQHQSIIFCEWN